MLCADGTCVMGDGLADRTDAGMLGAGATRMLSARLTMLVPLEVYTFQEHVQHTTGTWRTAMTRMDDLYGQAGQHSTMRDGKVHT